MYEFVFYFRAHDAYQEGVGYGNEHHHVVYDIEDAILDLKGTECAMMVPKQYPWSHPS